MALVTAAEAAQRLGVKQATLYAYVSRGVLGRRKTPDGRGSLFDAGEIEQLARRGRPRRQARAADIVVESAITEIEGGQVRYRGRTVTDLAVHRSFEEVAAWLWAGRFPAAPAAGPARWQARPEALAAGRAAQAALPPGALPLERLQVIVPAMAAADPLRLQLGPAAVAVAGESIIAGLVDCLPDPPADPPDPPDRAPESAAAHGGTVAPRLWARLSARRPAPRLLGALSAALVLVADHELAASTLAARVAASVRADPYAVVATGLGAVGGALHGGASLGAETLLAAATAPADVPRVIRDVLRRGERVPGFGHFVYRAGDPRAVLLLDLVRAAAPRDGRLAVAEAVLAEVAGKGLPGPNIDFALAVLTQVAGMAPRAGEAVFAIARTAGWIAHAIEEYERNTPLRPRAVYTGPPAQDG